MSSSTTPGDRRIKYIFVLGIIYILSILPITISLIKQNNMLNLLSKDLISLESNTKIPTPTQTEPTVIASSIPTPTPTKLIEKEEVSISSISPGIHLNTSMISWNNSTAFFDIDGDGNNTVFFKIEFINNTDKEQVLDKNSLVLSLSNNKRYDAIYDYEVKNRFETKSPDDLNGQTLLNTIVLKPSERIARTIAFRLPATLHGSATIFLNEQAYSTVIN